MFNTKIVANSVLLLQQVLNYISNYLSGYIRKERTERTPAKHPLKKQSNAGILWSNVQYEPGKSKSVVKDIAASAREVTGSPEGSSFKDSREILPEPKSAGPLFILLYATERPSSFVLKSNHRYKRGSYKPKSAH